MSNRPTFPIEYTVVRSKRKTLCVSVGANGVTVKAPSSATVAHIEKFLFEKQKWIEKKLAEQRKKTDFFKDFADGKCVMYHGTLCKITLDAAHKRTKLEDGTLYIPAKYAENSAEQKAVAAWGKRVASDELATALGNLSARTGLGYKSFSLTNAKTKWGSCDGKNNIMLNWRLIMLDNELVAYVIVHELAHTVHHDHSAAFWAEVKRRLPDCDRLKKRLKTFSTLTTLYR